MTIRTISFLALISSLWTQLAFARVLPKGVVHTPYKTELANVIPDGSTFHYSLMAGPGWVNLDDKGVVTGTPSTVGVDHIDVLMCSDLLCGTENFTIEVLAIAE